MSKTCIKISAIIHKISVWPWLGKPFFFFWGGGGGICVFAWKNCGLNYMCHVCTFFSQDPENDNKLLNSHLILNSRGDIVARYSKTHLFSADIKDQVRLQESDHTTPGMVIVPPVQTPVGQVGLGIVSLVSRTWNNYVQSTRDVRVQILIWFQTFLLFKKHRPFQTSQAFQTFSDFSHRRSHTQKVQNIFGQHWL